MKSERKDMVNKICGLLTVLSFSHICKKEAFWLCKCQCGKNTTVGGKKLRNGNTKSCGCLRLKLSSERIGKYSNNRTKDSNVNWRGYGEISGQLWNQIKNRYNYKNLECSISIEYAWKLFLRQERKCALTGQLIYFGNKARILENKIETTASLDRIDSLKGYVEGNVQWVHKDINLMKLDLTQDDFIKNCKLVYNHSLKESNFE